MGTTRFKLFSSTGPSVAMGLALALLATLSLTPALLIVLARVYPRAFDGFANRSTAYWDRLGSAAMARPVRSWGFTLLAMIPLAILGLRTEFIQDLLTELPERTRSVEDFHFLATKFDPGVLAPLTVVLESDTDFRKSDGLALIDDVSRLLAHHRRITEVRSATQPLGSPEPLSRARLASRLGEVNAGFHQLSEGSGQLSKGLTEGAAKLRAAIWLEEATGLSLTGAKPAEGLIPKSDASVARARGPVGRRGPGHRAQAGVGRAAMEPGRAGDLEPGRPAGGLRSPEPGVRLGVEGEALGTDDREAARGSFGRPATSPGGDSPGPDRSKAAEKPKVESPPEVLLRELTRAAEGAAQISEGADRARIARSPRS